MTTTRETFDPNLIGRCPHPFKNGFVDEERALIFMEDHGILDLVPYKCRCGTWHTGHPIRRDKKFREVQARVIGDGEVIIGGDGRKYVRRMRHRAAG